MLRATATKKGQKAMTADAKLTEWDVIEAMRSDRGVAGMSPVDVLGDRYPARIEIDTFAASFILAMSEVLKNQEARNVLRPEHVDVMHEAPEAILDRWQSTPEASLWPSLDEFYEQADHDLNRIFTPPREDLL